MKRLFDFLLKHQARFSEPSTHSASRSKQDSVFIGETPPEEEGHSDLDIVLTFNEKLIHLLKMSNEMMKSQEKLQHQATHDDLTGLYNRASLLEYVTHEIVEGRKYNTEFAVLFFDLDKFKLVNDTFSHAVGDDLLRGVANRLQNIMRRDDILARLGGDEFVVVIRDIRNEDAVIAIAHKLVQSLQQPFKLSGLEVNVTASVGISFYPTHGQSADILLKHADAAMYRAKEEGSNHFEIYVEEHAEKSKEKAQLEIALRKAIVEDELFLVYQPQIELSTQKLLGLEALVRWRHPVKGVLMPVDFIPIAERTGLMAAISERVLFQACRQNKAWQDAGLKPIRVAVNVNAEQLKHQDILAWVSSVLEQTKLNPEYLELELTEETLIANPNMIELISSLKSLGLSIALDDFGVGYASLSCLNKIPLDRLKIDSSLIQRLHSDEDDELMIRSLIEIAKHRKIRVLAEGVETAVQHAFLKANGCEEVQGFYYSQALSAQEIANLLRESALPIALKM